MGVCLIVSAILLFVDEFGLRVGLLMVRIRLFQTVHFNGKTLLLYQIMLFNLCKKCAKKGMLIDKVNSINKEPSPW